LQLLCQLLIIAVLQYLGSEVRGGILEYGGRDAFQRNNNNLDTYKVETPIHDGIRESVTWECKEHGVKS
jgi:hypothetical protein